MSYDDDENDEGWNDESTNNAIVSNTNSGDYEYDLYNLTSYNYQPIEINDETDGSANFEDQLYALSCHAAQDLVNKLFLDCPIQPSGNYIMRCRSIT